MSIGFGRVQRGGSPFAGGGGHTSGHTFCVSTPHPAYGVSDDSGTRQGKESAAYFFTEKAWRSQQESAGKSAKNRGGAKSKNHGVWIRLHSLTGIAYPTVRQRGLHPSGHPAKTKKLTIPICHHKGRYACQIGRSQGNQRQKARGIRDGYAKFSRAS